MYKLFKKFKVKIRYNISKQNTSNKSTLMNDAPRFYVYQLLYMDKRQLKDGRAEH